MLDGRLLRLGLQAYALGIAYEFDPYFGLSISSDHVSGIYKTTTKGSTYEYRVPLPTRSIVSTGHRSERRRLRPAEK